MMRAISGPESGQNVAPARAPLSPRMLRQVLGRFATGVAVATTISGGRPRGLTVNSFTSVSLSPALILICIHHRSAFLTAAIGRGGFAINVIDDDHLDVVRLFADPEQTRQRAWPNWEPSPSGLPLLEGAVAYLDCALDTTHAAGDHVICIAEVRGVEVAAGHPLLFVGGRFRSIGPICDLEQEVLKNWAWI
ncbi:MAG: flavin reductase family protein [Acetobacteraceae bacterium]